MPSISNNKSPAGDEINFIRSAHDHLYCRLGAIKINPHPLSENFLNTKTTESPGREIDVFYEPGLDNKFVPRQGYISPEASIAPTAQIAPGAIISPGAEIGAAAVIGARTVIGPNTRVGENMNIGADAFIGNSCLIDFAGKISAGVYIGDNNTIISNAPGQFEIDADCVILDNNKLINMKKIGTRVFVGTENLLSNETALGADSVIGSHNTIFHGALGPGVVIHNRCDIDRPTSIGPGCQIFDDIRIRAGLTMAAGVELFKVGHIEATVTIGANAKIHHVDYIGFAANIHSAVEVNNCSIIRDFDVVISSPPKSRVKTKFIAATHLKNIPRIFRDGA